MKFFFYFLLWPPFCEVELNKMSNFGKGPPKDNPSFVEIHQVVMKEMFEVLFFFFYF